MFVRCNRRLAGLLATASLLISVTALSPGVVAAQSAASGHLYVMNNNPGGTNSITVFARAVDGSLSQQATAGPRHHQRVSYPGQWPASLSGRSSGAQLTPERVRSGGRLASTPKPADSTYVSGSFIVTSSGGCRHAQQEGRHGRSS